LFYVPEAHAVNKTIFANMSKDFDTEEDLHVRKSEKSHISEQLNVA